MFCVISCRVWYVLVLTQLYSIHIDSLACSCAFCAAYVTFKYIVSLDTYSYLIYDTNTLSTCTYIHV